MEVKEGSPSSSDEVTELLNTLVDELQTSFVSIPFEAWRYVCKKTRDDLKIRFPKLSHLKDLTETEERMYYARYVFHVTQNYKEFFTCLLTGFPVPPFSADVENLLIQKARNPVQNQSTILRSSAATSSSSVKKGKDTKFGQHPQKKARLIDYEDTDAEVGDDDDASSCFSEANLVTSGARRKVTNNQIVPSPLSSGTSSETPNNSKTSKSTTRHSLLDEDFLLPTINKEVEPGATMSETSERLTFINPERPAKQKRPSVPIFQEDSILSEDPRLTNSPPTPPPAPNPASPSSSSSGSTPLKSNKNCINNNDAYTNQQQQTESNETDNSKRPSDLRRIKQEVPREKPPFVEEIEWYTPRLLAPECQRPYKPRTNTFQITSVDSPPQCPLEGTNELTKLDPRNASNNNDNNNADKSRIVIDRNRRSVETPEQTNQVEVECSTTESSHHVQVEKDFLSPSHSRREVVIEDKANSDGEDSYEEVEEIEEDDLEVGIPVTSETFEESFERRASDCTSQSSSSSIVSDRSSYIDKPYVTIRRKSTTTTTHDDLTTHDKTNNHIQVPVIVPSPPTSKPVLLSKLKTNLVQGQTQQSSFTNNHNNNSNYGQQTFQQPLLPIPLLPTPQHQQQQQYQQWPNQGYDQGTVNPTPAPTNNGQVFAAAATALAFSSTSTSYSATLSNNGYGSSSSSNNITVSLHPQQQPNPFIPNPFETSANYDYMSTNGMSASSSYNNNLNNNFSSPGNVQSNSSRFSRNIRPPPRDTYKGRFPNNNQFRPRRPGPPASNGSNLTSFPRHSPN